ncbi:MAG: CheR family methyltransferase [Bacteroidota bacterium]
MDRSKEFRLVGIGASAGGLDAIREFFDHIPDDTGLAFVVVQHLSRDFKSMMKELLSKHTQMPRIVVDQDIFIRPNHIYLISPNNNISVEEGILKIIDRNTSSSPNLPIDIFFHALGKDFLDQSIGVVLSGTGTDGSRGIRSIKEGGGLVYVQSPSSAQFNGMPNASIAMGLADNILPPSQIAQEIVNIAKKSKNVKKSLINTSKVDDLSTFQKILELIEQETQIDFKEYRRSTLVRRLEKRMYLNHIHDLLGYYQYLMENRSEVQILYKEFLIGVTRFFRDDKAFDILYEKTFGNIFEHKKPKEQIRVWCVGCSSGEEAYSLAILLMEYIKKNDLPHSFKIFATDLDQQSIRTGSLGVYPDNIVSDIPTPYLEKYFIRKGNEYVISKNIRENIVFTTHDALRDPPFINVDLISCRNMMIYFNSNLQRNLLLNFQFALNFNGFLFLGPSETLGAAKQAFEAINNKWNIYRKIAREKPVLISQKSKISPRLLNTNNQLSEPNGTVTIFQQLENTFAKKMAEKYAPRTLFVNKNFNIIYINGEFHELLKFPRAYVTMNLLKLVDDDQLLFKTGVRKALESDEVNSYQNIKYQSRGKVFDLNINFQRFDTDDLNELLISIEFFINGEKRSDEANQTGIGFENYQDDRIKTLEFELRQVHKEKQALIEQIETTNEELQSSNEELLAANEELQSTNEELQSVNEELYTVNTELQTKVDELITFNNDINNLLESTEIGTVFLDKELKIRKFTPALQEQFNLEKSDIGRSITNFANAFDDPHMYDEIKMVVEHGKIREREVQDKAKNHYLMRILPYRKGDGLKDGVIITFININELKNIQADLVESAENFLAIVENSADFIVKLDVTGEVIFLNQAKERNVEDIIGSHLADFLDEAHQEIFINAFEKITKQKSKYESFEVMIPQPSGTRVWINFSALPILVNDEIKNILLIGRDITTLKESEENLKEASQALELEAIERNRKLEMANLELKEVNNYLDSFVHGAAHDLRAPVMQMKGMINLFPKIDSLEKKENIIKQFGDGISHLENTLNGLIDLVEFQKNTEQITTSIDLIEVFEEVRQQLSHEITEVKASIETNFVKRPKIRYILHQEHLL